MPLSEFELIRKYLQDALADAPGIIQGIGDDAAVVRVPPGQDLVLSMDTLVTGVHFPDQTPAEDIGYRSLAVNLSDLAAMGAEPRWISLSLTMPESNETWLQGFMHGLSGLAKQYSMALVGGDVSKGPLSITIQVHGWVPEGQAIYRSGARPGDRVYVSGTLGDAGLALQSLQDAGNSNSTQSHALPGALLRPNPRVHLGLALRGYASAAIDVSDGLIADLGHILSASQCGAVIKIHQLPLSDAVRNSKNSIDLALAGGDDYELCFTVSPQNVAALDSIQQEHAITCIGNITAGDALECLQQDGSLYYPERVSYRHF